MYVKNGNIGLESMFQDSLFPFELGDDTEKTSNSTLDFSGMLKEFEKQSEKKEDIHQTPYLSTELSFSPQIAQEVTVNAEQYLKHTHLPQALDPQIPISIHSQYIDVHKTGWRFSLTQEQQQELEVMPKQETQTQSNSLFIVDIKQTEHESIQQYTDRLLEEHDINPKQDNICFEEEDHEAHDNDAADAKYTLYTLVYPQTTYHPHISYTHQNTLISATHPQLAIEIEPLETPTLASPESVGSLEQTLPVKTAEPDAEVWKLDELTPYTQDTNITKPLQQTSFSLPISKGGSIEAENVTPVQMEFTQQIAAPISLVPESIQEFEHIPETQKYLNIENTTEQKTETPYFTVNLAGPSSAGIQQDSHFDSKAVIEQVKVHVHSAIRTNAKTIKFILHPENLGEIQITFNEDKLTGHTKITVIAEQQNTGEILSSINTEIKAALIESGFQNGEFTLSTGMQDSNNTFSNTAENMPERDEMNPGSKQDKTQDIIISRSYDMQINLDGKTDIMV